MTDRRVGQGAMPPRARRPLGVVVIALAWLVAACGGVATPTPIPATPSRSPSTSPSPVPVPSPSSSPGPTLTPAPTAVPPTEWSDLVPGSLENPAAREDHTWTVATDSGIAYLFGGRDGARTFDDLWSFDLARERWLPLQPSGDAPVGRFGHEAIWVAGVGLVVWDGQADATHFFDDLWAYDPDTNDWRELPQAGARPAARYGSCSGLGPDGRLWVSHGFTADDGRFADTWAYDFGAGRWSRATPDGRGPVERCLHGCWWTDDGRFVLYAGQTTGVTALDDLWILGSPGTPAAAWARSGADRPAARNLYAAARHGPSTIVVGGRGNDGYLADIVRFDDATLTAEAIAPLGAAPAARSGGALIDDPARARLLLFGGRDARGSFDDLWALTLP